MKHGSLFSGIGGFDLAAQWMGWENVFHCEWDEFCQNILKYYWPNAKSYGDIDGSDFRQWRGLIDVLSGGFPCQPYSTAGNRKGKEDDRHKWPQMLRAIREISPRWIVGENVRGLTNWNKGMVFDEVQSDLEAEGYEVLPFLLPACAVNAPHRRERIWFIAHSKDAERKLSGDSRSGWSGIAGVGGDGVTTNTNGNGQYGSNSEHEINASKAGFYALCNTQQSINDGTTPDPKCIRQQGQGWTEGQRDSKTFGNGKASWSYDDGRWPTQPPVCRGNDGVSGGLDGITISKHSKESIKGYGNAVVPQVVYQIFKTIQDYAHP